MKTLIQHIAENKALHQNGNIAEKLIINKNYNTVKYHPKTPDELKQLIIDRFEELGPGTKNEPIDFNDIDVSNIDSFSNNIGHGLFEKMEFEYIDISEWDVSKVEDMRSIFYLCKKLKSVGDLSGWDVSNVEDMSYMFGGCEELQSVGDLSNWNVSEVENISYMFYDCHQLKSVGHLSDWAISKVSNMNSMFGRSGITNKPNWYQ